MFDWNNDGKIDFWDHAMTAMILDDMEDDKSSGCCGPTVAMFLIGLILPVVVGVVFITH